MNIKTKTKKRKPIVKPPRVSNHQILEQILKRLDNVDYRLDNVEKHLKKHNQLFEVVLDQFKKHKWIK